jgi:hypothetical protein
VEKIVQFHEGMGKIYGMFGVKGFNVWWWVNYNRLQFWA